MKRKVLVFCTTVLFAIFAFHAAFAQSNAVKKWIKEGEQAFQKEQYVVAFDRFYRAYEKAQDEEKADLSYQLGLTQLQLNHPKEAYVFFQGLWNKGRRDSSFLKQYAWSMMQMSMYDSAYAVYCLLETMPIEKTPLFYNRKESARIGMQADSLDLALLASDLMFQEKINSSFSEYGPSILDGRMVFASSRPVGSSMDTRTGHGYSRLYTAYYDRMNKQWIDPVDLSNKLNKEKTNVGTFTYDSLRNIGYYMWSRLGRSGIYTSQRSADGGWEEAKEFEINKFEGITGHPAISSDGNRLLFSGKSTSGNGSLDIWFVERTAESRIISKKPKRSRPSRTRTSSSSRGKAKEIPLANTDWKLPINLGNLVNTSGREVFPSWIDDYTFAFSSDGLVGYGGLDLYIARFDSSYTQIVEQYHLPAPINSSYDDCGLLLQGGYSEGFFVSNRYQGPGKTDNIYSFPRMPGNTKITAKVLDEKSGSILNADAVLVYLPDRALPDTAKILADGSFEYKGKTGANYQLKIKKKGYFDKIQAVDFTTVLNYIPLSFSKEIMVYMYPDTNKIRDSIEAAYLAFKEDSLALVNRQQDSIQAAYFAFKEDSLIRANIMQDSIYMANISAIKDSSFISEEVFASTVDTSWKISEEEIKAVYQEEPKELLPPPVLTDVSLRSEKNFEADNILVNGSEMKQDLSQYLQEDMSARQMIAAIDQYKKEPQTVNKRFVDDYKKNVNDPVRRSRLQVLPMGVKCDVCDERARQRKSGEPFFVKTADDKALITMIDNAGNKSFIDVAPNAAYEIKVENIQTAGGAPSLPSNIEVSDIRKTVVNKDYIVYECSPKLSELGEEVYINNLYFDFDKADLIKDASRELDRMIIVAIKNPKMIFEISAHADERGSDEYNVKLTEKRLESAVNYISKKGFDVDRIQGKAYGKSQPIIKNALSDAEHQLNRRTTFRLFLPEAEDQVKQMPNYPVAENKPKETLDISYKIQLGAFRLPLEDPLAYYAKILSLFPQLKLTYYMDTDGLYKYNIAEFRNIADARKLAKQILEQNTECYIAAYHKGIRITVAESLAIINRMKR